MYRLTREGIPSEKFNTILLAELIAFKRKIKNPRNSPRHHYPIFTFSYTIIPATRYYLDWKCIESMVMSNRPAGKCWSNSCVSFVLCTVNIFVKLNVVKK